MQRLDNIFGVLSKKLNIDGNYNAEKINFVCLRTTIDSYESKCGKLSDYGLGYIKYFAQGCEKYAASTLLEKIEC